MALRRNRPKIWRPRGVSDAVDGTNAFPGAMSALANLVASPDTPSLFVPRPAAVALPAFTGFTSAVAVSVLLTVGNIAYGMISSGRFVGKDEPFAFNLATNALLPITGQLAANLPTSQATTGDWTPPTASVIAGSVVFTHPGFAGGTVKFGWLDISSFSIGTLTGTTSIGSTSITAVSSNPITAGVQPGMTVTGIGIPAGATVVSLTATTIVISAAATANGSPTLTIAGGTAAAPLWGAGDTNTNNLSAVPVAVGQFNGRAYYAIADGVVMSDPGSARQVTNPTQALTFRNKVNVTALAGLPLRSSTQGGMIQSMIAFQGASRMQQIQGDPATRDLTVNELNVASGTLAPNTIAPTPLGLAFISPDGLRIIDFNATVSDPIGGHGQGVSVPFRYALYPSRMCAAFNQSTLRLTVQNGRKGNQPVEEYWLDFDTKMWTGPHSFPAALIQPWQGTNNTFVMAPSPSLQTAATTPTTWGSFTWGAAPWGGVPIAAQLWRSDVQPSATSTYTENGSAMSWTYTTVLLPDTEDMSANAMVEATIGLQLPSGSTVTVIATNERSTVLDTVSVTGAGGATTTWGAFTWGASNWTFNQPAYAQYALPWTKPLVFKQAAVSVSGASAAGAGIGNLYLSLERLGYMINGVAA